MSEKQWKSTYSTYPDENFDRFGKRRLPPRIQRHQLDPGQCAYCDREREAKNDFFPSHDASPNCESGKREHCTCDTCF